MNKSSNRYETLDPISKIQADLKEMKVEVSHYIKGHRNDRIPPNLKQKNHILIDAINENRSSSQNLNPKKMVKDFSSQKLGPILEGNHFQKLREYESDGRERSKIVQQKRLKSTKIQLNSGDHAGQSFHLPNICNVKLEFDDQNIINQSMNRLKMEERSFLSMLPNPYQQISKNIGKRYCSFELEQSALLDRAIKSTVDGTLKGCRQPLIQNDKATLKHFRNISYPTKHRPDPFLQTLTYQQKLKHANFKSKQLSQTIKRLNQYQKQKQADSSLNRIEFSHIIESQRPFDGPAQHIQKRKVYSKINHQLLNRPSEKMPKMRNISPRHHISYVQMKDKDQFGGKITSKFLQPLEPWRDQKAQTQKSQFIFQNTMF